MRHYEELGRFERNGFEIIVDKTWEYIDPWDQLSECVDEQLYEDIQNCKYDWFMLRVRAMLNDKQMACEYLGGCLYENAEEVLTDGVVEDLLTVVLPEAHAEAKRWAASLQKMLALVEN